MTNRFLPISPSSPLPPAAISFDNTFAREMSGLYVSWKPTHSPAPTLVRLNRKLALELGLDADAMESPESLSWLAGNEITPGSEPLAQAYAGHQFGNFSPSLGDGRALLLGELIDIHGQRHDLALKGSGPTPFSRGGDGKATLGSVLREYLMAEAMQALGIPTTRALAALTTGERIAREGTPPGAILARVAASHLRVGTFQFFAAQNDSIQLNRLANFAIARHDAHLTLHPDRILGLLEAVSERQAYLVARWMGVGFIHGVMNTDNMTLSGETIDYGPCAFMEHFDPKAVFSSIDRHGRYAYGKQPAMAQWNIARFAEALLPLLDTQDSEVTQRVNDIVKAFADHFERHWTQLLRSKIGLKFNEDGDRALADNFLLLLQKHRVDFTLAFRHLADAIDGEWTALKSLFSSQPGELEAWIALWRARLERECLPLCESAQQARSHNPFVIPRNHQVEAALTAAVEQQDMQPFDKLLEALMHPYDMRESAIPFTLPAAPELAAAHKTFCGT